jgi:hypothetical protein
LAEKISRFGLSDALLKYNSKPLEKEAKSIVAVPLLAVLKRIISNSNIVRRYHAI